MLRRWSICAALLAAFLSAGTLRAQDPQALDDAEFQQLHQLIKRQPGESRWMEVDWHPNVWEARKKAAAEGKPVFLMAGSGGAPAAGC
mgnify:CR=1 FL=1